MWRVWEQPRLYKVWLCSILQVVLHAVLQVAQVIWLHLHIQQDAADCSSRSFFRSKEEVLSSQHWQHRHDIRVMVTWAERSLSPCTAIILLVRQVPCQGSVDCLACSFSSRRMTCSRRVMWLLWFCVRGSSSRAFSGLTSTSAYKWAIMRAMPLLGMRLPLVTTCQ